MYKLETHAHTMEGSACSHIRGADLCRAYKKAGYNGLFITDHFYTCTPEILAGLGQMYVADDRFRKNIDMAGGEGTAAFVAQAIAAYCGK